jgi:recombination DNA repair RAD52 pathway protein
MFTMFLPAVQTEFTKVTRMYDHFKEKGYLLYIYVTAFVWLKGGTWTTDIHHGRITNI